MSKTQLQNNPERVYVRNLYYKYHISAPLHASHLTL